MALEEQDKKHLLYIGGALASIGALIWLFRRNAGQMPISGAGTGTTGGGGTSSALDAAKLNAAAALAIERGREDVTKAQIQAAKDIALFNAQTAFDIEQIRANAVNKGQGISAGAGLGKAAMDAFGPSKFGNKQPSGPGLLGPGGAQVEEDIPIYGPWPDTGVYPGGAAGGGDTGGANMQEDYGPYIEPGATSGGDGLDWGGMGLNE